MCHMIRFVKSPDEYDAVIECLQRLPASWSIMTGENDRFFLPDFERELKECLVGRREYADLGDLISLAQRSSCKVTRPQELRRLDVALRIACEETLARECLSV